MVPPPDNWRSLVGGSRIEADLLWYGLAPGTRRSYESVIRSFIYFCRLHAIPQPLFPVDPRTASAWIAWEAQSIIDRGGRLYTDTLNKKLSALASWHADLGYDAAVFSKRADRVIRGAHAKWGTATKQRPMPLTLPILKKVLATMGRNPDNYGGPTPCLALRTAFALGFACFFRMGEFTYDTFDESVHFTRSDVRFSDDGKSATITLKKSKTDQGRKGIEIAIPYANGAPYCPSSLLKEWLQATRRRAPNSPLFFLPGFNFAKGRVVEALRNALREAGYKAERFSGHSFRSGAATWAASIGIEADRIKILGRWSGDSFMRYIRTPMADHLAAASKILTTHHSASTLPKNGVPMRYEDWAAWGNDDDDQ